MTIKQTICDALSKGLNTAQVLEEVKAAFPNAKTSAACVAYYKSKMKKEAPAKAAPKAKAESVANIYTVKNLKSFIGMEGHGFNASLYRNGVLVAFVIDDASGGPLSFDWKDRTQPLVEVKRPSSDGKSSFTVKMTAEEHLLYEIVKAMPPIVCDWTDPNTKKPAILAMCEDLYVGELVEDSFLLSRIKKLSKTKVVMVKGGDLCSVKHPPTEENIAKVKKAHDGALVLNGLSDAEILAAAKKVA